MNIQSLSKHVALLRYQLGSPLRLGAHHYRIRGYLANEPPQALGHEPYLLPFLQRALKSRPGAFVDVGVNIGQTLMKVMAFDPSRQYVGFEPQLACSCFVERFINDNRLTNALVLPLGLSDSDGLCALHTSGNFDEMASIEGNVSVDGSSRGQQLWIQTRTGDAVIDELGVKQVAIIKVDVEGAEARVFAGFRKTLERARPILMFEVLTNFFGPERKAANAEFRRRNTQRALTLWRTVEDAGYEVRQIDTEGNERVVDAFNLDDARNFVGYDYVAYPR